LRVSIYGLIDSLGLFYISEVQIEMRYFETYYFATVVHGVLEDVGNYLRSLEDWGGDQSSYRFLVAYPKWSHLHSFIAFLIEGVIYERVEDVKLQPWYDGKYPELWIDQALRFYDIPAGGFDEYLKSVARLRQDATEDDVGDYHQELMLTGELESLVNQITEAGQSDYRGSVFASVHESCTIGIIQ
jgi:hypothetical protein